MVYILISVTISSVCLLITIIFSYLLAWRYYRLISENDSNKVQKIHPGGEQPESQALREEGKE